MTADWQSDRDRGKPKHSEENISELHFVPPAFRNDTTEGGVGSDCRLLLAGRRITLGTRRKGTALSDFLSCCGKILNVKKKEFQCGYSCREIRKNSTN
jgi:hypothetical protein